MEVVFFRSLINLAWVAALITWKGERWYTPDWRILIGRGVSGFLSLTSLVYALTLLELPVAYTLYWSSPLFILLFSWVFLAKKPPRGLVAWVIAAFGAVILLLEPRSTGFHAPLPYVFFGLLSGAFAALSYLAVRAATLRNGPHLIVAYFTGISTVLSAPFLLMAFKWPDPKTGGFLLLMGVLASIGQWALTRAHEFAEADITGALGLMASGVGALLGWVFLDETLNRYQWFGMGLLAVAVFKISWRKNENSNGSLSNCEP